MLKMYKSLPTYVLLFSLCLDYDTDVVKFNNFPYLTWLVLVVYPFLA